LFSETFIIISGPSSGVTLRIW